MKFSEIEPAAWEELQPYLDTCLLPVTGLTGHEAPAEVTEKLRSLQKLIDMIEIPFRGRVVTYPAIQYGNENLEKNVNDICRNVKSSGFVYSIVVVMQENWLKDAVPDADFILSPRGFSEVEGGTPEEWVKAEIQRLWQGHVNV
ncbi:DUF2487 family protein [Paenibacillus senegalimassiliensis]|uniref:DUF2487 family protein n=1 Tax=Paenibacillus senegalimassiliensis TaxID=1737426 RepID=UPI00073E9420|nr:DUF2487 family protein [Paenibacillus senegalimassiliensis]